MMISGNGLLAILAKLRTLLSNAAGLLLCLFLAATVRAELPAVDVENRIVRLGALNDLSGPGAAIGRPWALGHRVLLQQVNAGELDLLPDGWRIELLERDHRFDPERARQSYRGLRDRVLFLLTSFGSAINHALLPALQADNMVAFPASLDSSLSSSPVMPLVGSSYRTESERGFEWMLASATEGSVLRPAAVYRGDSYGLDGYAGWQRAAGRHGIELAASVRREEDGPSAADIVEQLRAARATHVLLSTLPDMTKELLAAAEEAGYAPIWLGNTAAWSDLFFDPRVAKASWFAHFYWLTGFPWWGEDHPLMNEFLDGFVAYGHSQSDENFYVLVSWLQGRIALQVLGGMLRAGETDRASFRQRLAQLEQRLQHPEAAAVLTGLRPGETRVLRPVIEMGSWQVVADYARPGREGAQRDSSQVRK